MKTNGIYSTRKLLVFAIAFVVIGASVAAVSAAAISIFQPFKEPEPPATQIAPQILVWTNKDAYRPGEVMSIGLANPMEAAIDFTDDAYGLRVEKLVDGSWQAIASFGDESGTTSLQSITESRGQGGKLAVNYQLGNKFPEGTYRVVSVGTTMKNGNAITVEGLKEFEVSLNAPASTPQIPQK